MPCLQSKQASLLSAKDEVALAKQISKIKPYLLKRDEMTEEQGQQPTLSEWATACGFEDEEVRMYSDSSIMPQPLWAAVAASWVPAVLTGIMQLSASAGSLLLLAICRAQVLNACASPRACPGVLACELRRLGHSPVLGCHCWQAAKSVEAHPEHSGSLLLS